MRDGKKLEWLEEKFGKKKEADEWIVILQHLEVVLFVFLFYFLSFFHYSLPFFLPKKYFGPILSQTTTQFAIYLLQMIIKKSRGKGEEV